jgi:hypothetical protein
MLTVDTEKKLVPFNSKCALAYTFENMKSDNLDKC